MKKNTFNAEAQEGLLKGVNILGEAVGTTMGAHGRTVLYRHDNAPNGIVQNTKDGVTVARMVTSKDPLERMGIDIVRDAARKTASKAGDGTTTSTVLAQAILNQAVNRDGSQRDYIRGMEAARDKVLDYLDNLSEEVNDEMIDYVASISTNNDEELGGIIAGAFKEVGEYGHVWYEPNPAGTDTYSKVEHGAQVPSGFIDPGFVTNNKSNSVDQENPLVFLTTSKIDTARQLETILQEAITKNRALTIIGDVDTQVGAVLLANRQKNGYKFNLVTPPYHGLFRRDCLQDLAHLTGATLHGQHLGDAAESITVDMLGEADFIQSSARDTVIRIKDRKDLTEQVEAITALINEETNASRKEDLKKRRATLAGGVAVVTVGAVSDGEMFEKLDRVDDAIHAVGASIREGVLPGGGVALLNAADSVKIPSGDDDYTQGFKALLSAIKKPYLKILSNADLKAPEGLKEGWGVNVLTGKKVDMKKEGIIDPTLATKEALRNAVGVSKTIMSTGLVIDDEE